MENFDGNLFVGWTLMSVFDLALLSERERSVLTDKSVRPTLKPS